jgi:predicted transcriptional regulator of viral defense system
MAARTEDRLYVIAEDQEGFFAARDATEAGIPAAAVQKLLASGRLRRVSRGVYHINKYPTSPRGEFWAAVLWPRGNADVRGVLSGETALLLHGGTDVNPGMIHVTIPKSFRTVRTPAPPIVVHFDDVSPDDIEYIDGLPVTTPERTLRDLRADPAQRRFAETFAEHLRSLG